MASALTFSNICQSTAGRTLGTFNLKSNGIDFQAGNDDTSVAKENISRVVWVTGGNNSMLHVYIRPSGDFKRFDGFKARDFDKFSTLFRQEYGLTLEKEELSTYAINAGAMEIDNSRKTLELKFQDRTAFEVPYSMISQCAVPGKNEIELQFEDDDTGPREDEMLVQMRFSVPAGVDGEDQSESVQNDIIEKAGIRGVTGNAICTLNENIGTFLTPRGKYMVEMHDKYFRMHGKTYNYKIMYKSISRMFLLPNVYATAFVISLDDPIQQGQQRYPHLVMNLQKHQDTLTINLTKEEIKEKYKNELQEIMEGDLPDLVAKLFKVMTKRKVFIPGDFLSFHKLKCVKCALKASQGLLYPLQRSFFFIHKPATFIRFEDVDTVEFQRYSQTSSSTAARSFDIEIICRPIAGEVPQSYVFSNIERNEYKSLFRFLSSKPLTIKNRKEAETDANGGVLDDDGDAFKRLDEEESDDSDFESPGEESSSADSSEESDGISEDEETGEKKRKKKKKKSKDGSAKGSPKAKKSKRDPNAPKRPKSEYMYFSIEYSKQVREENKDIAFGEVAKQVSAKWKEMKDEEKEKFKKLAEADKKRYEEELKTYTPPPGYSETGDARKSKKKSGEGGSKAAAGKSRKRKRDPNAPKRPKSEYMQFSMEYSKKLREENKDIGFGEVAKQVSAKWKEMDDEAKAKYKAMAEADKDRYEKELKDYTPGPGYSKSGDPISSPSQSSASPKAKKRKEEKQSKDESSSSSSSSSDSDSDSSSSSSSSDEDNSKAKSKGSADKPENKE